MYYKCIKCSRIYDCEGKGITPQANSICITCSSLAITTLLMCIAKRGDIDTDVNVIDSLGDIKTKLDNENDYIKIPAETYNLLYK